LAVSWAWVITSKRSERRISTGLSRKRLFK
jgi:hypothetical protein